MLGYRGLRYPQRLGHGVNAQRLFFKQFDNLYPFIDGEYFKKLRCFLHVNTHRLFKLLLIYFNGNSMSTIISFPCNIPSISKCFYKPVLNPAQSFSENISASKIWISAPILQQPGDNPALRQVWSKNVSLSKPYSVATCGRSTPLLKPFIIYTPWRPISISLTSEIFFKGVRADISMVIAGNSCAGSGGNLGSWVADEIAISETVR